MGRATTNKFGPAPWGPGEGSKGQISLNLNNRVNFKDFILNFVCVLTNRSYEIYQTGFLFWRLGNAPGVRLGAPGGPEGQKIFRTWSCDKK